jgi:hypothetical protein
MGDQQKKWFNRLTPIKAPSENPSILFTLQEANPFRILLIQKSEGVIDSKEEGFTAEDEEEENAHLSMQ